MMVRHFSYVGKGHIGKWPIGKRLIGKGHDRQMAC